MSLKVQTVSQLSLHRASPAAPRMCSSKTDQPQPYCRPRARQARWIVDAPAPYCLDRLSKSIVCCYYPYYGPLNPLSYTPCGRLRLSAYPAGDRRTWPCASRRLAGKWDWTLSESLAVLRWAGRGANVAGVVHVVACQRADERLEADAVDSCGETPDPRCGLALAVGYYRMNNWADTRRTAGVPRRRLPHGCTCSAPPDGTRRVSHTRLSAACGTRLGAATAYI